MSFLSTMSLLVSLAVTIPATAPSPSPTPTPAAGPAWERLLGRKTGTNTLGVDGSSDDSDHTIEPRRPVKGPPLVESRAIDPAMCQPGSSITYEPAYSYRCDGFELECEEDETLQPPRETRSRPSGAAEWGPWTALSPWQCVTPEEGSLIDDVRRAFAEMTITAPPVTVIDGRGWTFVQIDTIVYSDDTPQTLTTTVGGTPVELRATPIEWRWDFGDKTKPLTTTKPGGPYPDKTVTHVYTRLGTYTVTLTTTWQGQWRLVGETSWRDVDGQNTTTSTSDPFTTHEIRTRLVTPPS